MISWAELQTVLADVGRYIAEKAQEERIRNADGPGSDDVERLIPAREAARLLGVSVSYLYEHATEYPFTRRIGRAVRFERRGLLAWMNRGAVGA